MEQRLRAVAFILALLKRRLDFFHCKTDRDGTLGSQEGNPSVYIANKLQHRPTSSREGLGNSFLLDITRTPLPPITVSLSRHGWLNHWPSVIKCKLQLLSPPQRSGSCKLLMMVCLVFLATSPHPEALPTCQESPH